MFEIRIRSQFALPLLLLRADAADVLDGERRAAGFFGDLAVLLDDVAARGLVAFQPAQKLRRHTAVGALGAVFIDDVEEGKFAFGIGSGFLGHARLVPDQGAPVKENNGRFLDCSPAPVASRRHHLHADAF